MRTIRSTNAWLTLLLAFGLLAAACGGSGDGGDGAAEAGTTDSAAETDDELVEDAQQAALSDDETGANTADVGGEGDSVGGRLEIGSDEALEGGEIIYAIDSDGAGFDTTGAIQPGAIRIATAVVESLTQLLADGSWHPLLAESLTPNDDFTVWTIQLRPDVTFHDGASLDAEAAKANLDAFKNSPLTGFAVGYVAEYAVVGDLTVEVRMNQPWSTYPYALTAQGGWMVSPATIGTVDHMTGTGPFVMGDWTPGDGVRVERFDDYWRADEGIPILDAVEFKVVPENAARDAALRAGDIDAYSTPGDATLLDYLADDEVNVYQSGLGGNEFLIVPNLNNAPLDDLRIRQALMYAVDRDLLIENFRSGLTQKASSFIEPSSRWYVETDYPDFDMAMAQALVAEYEAENGEASFTLSVQNRESITEVTDFIISFWEEAGLEVDVRLMEPGADVPSVIQDDFDAITWFQHSAADPDGEWVFFNSVGGTSFLNWSNHTIAELDEVLNAGRSTDDFDTRFAAYARMQEIFAEQMPLLWFDHLSGQEGVASAGYLDGLNGALFPDGSEGAGVVGGSFHSYAGIFFVAE